MLHFLHDQPGATLRATELKPKLDRFIFNRFAKLFPNEKSLFAKLPLFEPKNVEGSHYKVSITSPHQTEKILVAGLLSYAQIQALNQTPFIQESPFFAIEEEVKKVIFEKTGRKIKRNPRDDKEFDELRLINNWHEKVSKLGILSKEPIKIAFRSFDEQVISILDKVLPYFFAYENFGTRQNKGFGCFSVENSAIPFEQLLKAVYPISYRKNIEYNERDILSRQQKQIARIQQDYKLMKSGRGASEKKYGGYHKSLIFLYGLQLNPPIRWEKRKIKQSINANKIRSVGLKSDSGNSAIYDQHGNQGWHDEPAEFNYFYLRAMLGLSEQFEFLSDMGSNLKYQVKVVNQDIDRFKSPITFKVHNNRIYLLAEEVDHSILNKKFEFTYKLNSDHSKPTSLVCLDTPVTFSIRDFLHFSLETSNEKIDDYICI